MTKPEIINLQKSLQRAGFYFGPIDGIKGPLTDRAWELFEASRRPTITAVTPAALKEIVRRILERAQYFTNLTEISPNARWDDTKTPGQDPRGAELRQALIDSGWQPKWAYCCSFAEVTWRYGYQGRSELPLIGQSITASCMSTYENFAELGRISKVPVPGAIMLMQKGNTWQGHAGIVKAIEDGKLITYEGNTSSNTENREGDGIYLKRKNFTLQKTSGLWIKGFVNPFTI